MHVTQHILLVRPSQFVYNEQTAASNAFQNTPELEPEKLGEVAIREFDVFSQRLTKAGVQVTVIEDTRYPLKPDAVFPNNWISTHADGTVVIYPMFAPNRRFEKRNDIIEKLKLKYVVSKVIDLSDHEQENRFLEGTGSIVFDHISRIAYACISPRTDKDLFVKVCGMLDYKPVHFLAYDRGGQEIYHTNVMMCVAEKFAIVCMESIIRPEDKALLTETFSKTGHKLITISFTQMNHFAGNMLAVRNGTGHNILVMSQSAHDTLTEAQRETLSGYCEILPMPIKTIEHIGGGSARCMMAEIFLPTLKEP